MKIQDFYKDVLSSLHYEVHADDLISFVAPGEGAVPATVDKKRLVLPTQERLREGMLMELQPFHPISENIARKGASPVLEHCQRLAKAYIAHHVVEISKRLLEVAADTTLQKDLPPKCSEYLKKVSDADKKMVQAFVKLTDEAIAKNKLVTLYLKNGGKLGTDQYNRLCVINFPILDLLKKADNQVLGVPLRKKDIKTIIALLEYVIPGGDDITTYSAGSNSSVSPFFDAFLRAYANIATQLNKLIKLYGKPVDLYHTVKEIDLTYMKSIDKMDVFYGQIAVLPGNEGKLAIGEEEDGPTASPQPNTSKAFSGVNTESTRSSKETMPWEEPKPVENTSKRTTVSMDEFRRSTQPQPQPQYGQPAPQYGQQPMQYGYQQPPAYGQQPVQQQYGYQQPQLQWGQPQQEPSPFASAIFGNQQQTPPPQSYGAYSGVSNWGQSQQQYPVQQGNPYPQGSTL